MNILELHNIIQKYKNKEVLNIKKLVVPESSVIGLWGPNGAGKSTLLRIIGLVEKPFKGEVFYKGKKVFPFSKEAREMTLLTQHSCLLKRSVFENIAYRLKIRGIKDNIEERVFEALNMVGLDPNKFARRKWYALSVGEAQRVALAARLVFKPKVLLLDEPTANVDIISEQLIKNAILKAVNKWGTTVIIASHNRSWLNEICHKIWHIFKGHVFDQYEVSFITGPWEKNSLYWIKKLNDKEKLVFKAPKKENVEIAVIKSSEIKLLENKINTTNCIKFIVANLSLDSISNKTVINLKSNDISFSIKLSPEKVLEKNIFLGRTLYFLFPEEVEWI